jgi:hypothetical protein
MVRRKRANRDQCSRRCRPCLEREHGQSAPAAGTSGTRCESVLVNWSSFVPDLVVACFGAALTVLIAFGTYVVQRRRQDVRVMRIAADDLASRRAFELIEPRTSRGDSDDADRCRRSVDTAQQQLGALRDQMISNRPLRAMLQDMVRATRDYKDMIEREPDRWQFALMRVREELTERLRDIERLLRMRSGELPDPGSLRKRSD